MSGIVLSSSVRQNLLSLQSTADLLATTQNRLATGKKVNTALDNPTNYFTASALDSRASDISNLLDGVSNGVQVLQAANTGITSLQKLVDGDSITVNGKTITFNLANTTTTLTSSTDAFGNVTLFTKSAGTKAAVSDLLSAIDTAAGNSGTGSVASTVANSGGATSALQLN